MLVYTYYVNMETKCIRGIYQDRNFDDNLLILGSPLDEGGFC